MLYATRFRVPDALVFLESRGRTALLLSDLELARGRREARVDEVASFSELEKELQGRKKQNLALATVVD
jgi:Xaa-Pro aminopeptidase